MQIIQPKGFITNTAPLIEWEAIDGAMDHEVTITNNVTGNVVFTQIVNGTSHQLNTPLALGTYIIQVTTGESIATELVIVTDTIAQYTVVGREGDVNYTAYKAYQIMIRQQAKQVGQMAANVLSTNSAITELLVASGDTSLQQYHANTIKQTPGLQSDFTEFLTKLAEIVTIAQRINKRDPQF